MVDKCIHKNLSFSVVELVIISGKPDSPKDMRDDSALVSVLIEGFVLNIHPQLGPILMGQLVYLLNNLNPRFSLQFLPEMYGIPALKKDMGGGFQFLFTEMTMRVNIHPYTVKINIGGQLVQGKKSKEGLDFIGSIGLPNGLEVVGIFISVSLHFNDGLIYATS